MTQSVINNYSDIVHCNDCGKELKLSELKNRNKYPERNDYFCDTCLDECSKCGTLFADYGDLGVCESCAD